MAIPIDIIVKRMEGASVQQPFVSGVAKIGVIGRSRGKNTAATLQLTATGDTAPLDSALSPIRSIINATGDDGTAAENETFYPNIHFLVKEGTTILNPSNLGIHDDPTLLYLDWTNAPPLVPATATASLVAGTTGGFSSATTVYYSLTVIDHNSNESNVGSITKVQMSNPTPGYWHVQLSWRIVEYSSGYKVYRGTLADGSDLGLIGTIASKNTVVFTDTNITKGAVPPTINTTVIKPTTSGIYTLNYYYGLITTMTYKEFTSYSQVVEEHGTGSELSNVARIYMNPEFNNAPVFATVVPVSTNYNSYLDAAGIFAENHVQFINPLYAGTTTLSTFINYMQPFYSLTQSLSDPDTGQKECYLVFALPFKTGGWSTNDCKTVTEAFQAMGDDQGKRAFFVVPAGHEVTASTWVNETGAGTSDYTHTDPASVNITPTVMAGAAIARYAGFRDPAEPLTEKDVVGFIFKGRNFTNTEIELLRGYGCMVIENVNSVAVVSQSINMSNTLLGIEDGELSICVTEDWMLSDLRTRLKKYRGKKMLGKILRAAKGTITDALRQYVDNQRIRYFDPASVDAIQDPNQKDKLRGYFSYMPVYPINRILIEYEFTYVVL